MTPTRRIAATLVATAALAAPTTVAISAAEAKPAPAKAVKSQAKQLLKDIAGKDKRLVRLAASHAVIALADDVETGVVANIADSRAALAEVATAVQAADSTIDTRAARKELRSFRVENFRLVVNVLEQVDRLGDEAGADPEAQAFLAGAEAAALAVTATSSKADVKAARALLRDAEAELAVAPSV